MNIHVWIHPGKTFSVTTQVNFSLSENFASLERAKLWTISCIRPNDSGSPNSFDKHRVISQIRSLLLPDLTARKTTDYVADYELLEFCERYYIPTMRGWEEERIIQCARANGWKERAKLWTISCIRPNDSSSPNSFNKCCVKSQIRSLLLPDLTARKTTDYAADYELLEFCERYYVSTMRGSEEERIIQCARANGWKERARLWTISCIRPNDSGSPNSFDKCRVKSQIRSLLLPDLTARKTTDYVADYEMLESCERYYGAPYQSPNAPYDFGGPQNRGVFESDYDKKDPRSPGVGSLAYSARDTVKESGDMVVKEVPNAVVEIPSTKSGRYCQWLWVVWLTTWWIPNFMLQYIGRMKRPDIRLAWREKVTIFWLIFLFNALVIFYIVEFGRLLCPNFDKSWGSSEVAQHQGSNDYWVSVAGVVYDLSNFINGDHSNGYFGIASNSLDVLDALAGSDLTYYFPSPLISACTSGLVTDGSLLLTRKNFMDLEPLAQHVSGQLQTTVPDMKSNSWYTNTFLAKMKTMQKGPLVLTKQTLAANAADTTIAK